MLRTFLASKGEWSLPSSPFFHARLPLPPGITQSYQVAKVSTVKGIRHQIGPSRALQRFQQDAFFTLLDIRKADQDWALINTIRDTRCRVSLYVEIKFFFPSQGKRNMSGGIDTVLDVVFTWLELNNSLVKSVTSAKFVDAEDPRCEIAVCCLVGK
ncbi:hypothetical protein KDW_27970 [Dictyobacter vulcani]|uniref:Uncharacterized protein n=1 Tax=Dictyobacter vulcani TaxID=2607529 RepID=A0A5J4KL99_9CHLR|nr:hypothetical protein [Dictyobacter vulcani]GER88635.1 hypothetical protein KDW_27970 [Dictyobacter vulcani]